ncbi:MAG: DUF87 domain-containing protein [Acidobacteriota bacterium]
MTKLRISSNFSLPIDAVTQTFAVLAKRGVGKSYLAAVIAEEMLKANIHIVIVDPVGVFWGLRASADGRGPGLPIIILGGEHSDVPLEETAGTLIADLTVDERISSVLDLSLFRKSQQTRFMTDFCERLYHRNREPLHLILDEGDSFAPQRPMPGEQRLLGAVEDLVRRGRARGIGMTLTTQRAAVINKNVLTQTETLIALRTIAPQDRNAIDEWIKVHGTPEQRDTLMTSLASLPIGTAWIWSPGWLDVFQKIQVRARETFDSSATPKAGRSVAPPRKLADVDLSSLRQRIEDTIKRAEENDPKLLRKRIAELEKQGSLLQSRIDSHRCEAKAERVEVPVITPADLEKAQAVLAQLDRAKIDLQAYIQSLEEVISPLRDALAKAVAARTAPPASPPARRPAIAVEKSLPVRESARRPAADNSDLQISQTQQRILDALAWYESIGIREPSNLQIGAVALIDSTGGHFSNVVGPLSSHGLVERGGGVMRLTEKGRARASIPERISTLDEYHDMLRARVRRARSASGRTVEMLDAIIAHGGEAVSAEEIGRAVGIDHTGGHFSNTIGPLSTLGFIERRQGIVRPTEILFPPGLE